MILSGRIALSSLQLRIGHRERPRRFPVAGARQVLAGLIPMVNDRKPLDHTKRFSRRVDVYRRFRSRYPREIVDLLRQRCGLAATSVIADIGSGTGMLAEVFLENGNRVFAIEPNSEMRSACRELEASHSGLCCVDGTAEATTLAGQSVDFVTAGRAFHWFNHELCRPEFARILRQGGWVMFANEGRRKGSEPLLQDYEDLLVRHGSDYASTRAQYDMEGACRKFFLNGEIHRADFPSVQKLDYQELEGQTLSFSVMPMPGDPGFPALRLALQDYFTRHQSGGRVPVPTDCTIYFGQLLP
jgi:SAM-dependent methyltransferase